MSMDRPEDHFYAPEQPGPRQRQCPDCGALLVKRTSRKQGLLCAEVFYQCSYILCGATFKGYDEIVYRLKVPSQTNPLIRLPRSPSQKHVLTGAPGIKSDCCPDCGERLHKQLVATADPFVFVAYVECSRLGCDWAASAPVELEPVNKEKPV